MIEQVFYIQQHGGNDIIVYTHDGGRLDFIVGNGDGALVDMVEFIKHPNLRWFRASGDVVYEAAHGHYYPRSVMDLIQDHGEAIEKRKERVRRFTKNLGRTLAASR